VKRPHSDSWWSPANTLCLTNVDRTIVFVWQNPNPEYRRDGQVGYNCSLFRNEDTRLSSEIILEAEQIVNELWGKARLYTYVDANQVASRNPGYCFKKAGWHHIGKSKSGKLLFEKLANLMLIVRP